MSFSMHEYGEDSLNLIIDWYLTTNKLEVSPADIFVPPTITNEIPGADCVGLAGLPCADVRFARTPEGPSTVIMIPFREADVIIKHYADQDYEFVTFSETSLYFLKDTGMIDCDGTGERIYALVAFELDHTHCYLVAESEVRRTIEYVSTSPVPDTIESLVT